MFSTLLQGSFSGPLGQTYFYENTETFFSFLSTDIFTKDAQAIIDKTVVPLLSIKAVKPKSNDCTLYCHAFTI
jgi:hypothetical protein